MEEVIGFFKEKENIKKVFTTVDVKLDYDHLTLMGHSFGGATVLFTALKNK